jgi:hypothetical protein
MTIRRLKARRRAHGNQCGLKEQPRHSLQTILGASGLDVGEALRPMDRKGRDAGVMVVCYRPLDTDKEVTTIVLAGHSGFATFDMAMDFVRDELRFEAHELRPHAVTMRVLTAIYKKRAGRGDSRSRVAKGGGGSRDLGHSWSLARRRREQAHPDVFQRDSCILPFAMLSRALLRTRRAHPGSPPDCPPSSSWGSARRILLPTV